MKTSRKINKSVFWLYCIAVFQIIIVLFSIHFSYRLFYYSLFVFCCLDLLFFCHLKSLRLQINALVNYLSQLNYSPHCHLEIYDNFEGSISILKNEIYRTAITLQEQANRLEKEKQFLSNSIADISHQLKTPLTSLIMISDLLQTNNLKEAQARELLRDMKTILNKLEWLITSLLSFAKFDSGQIQLKSTPLNLANVISKVLKSLEIAIEVKDIKIITSCDENITILADEQWTCEALQNILKNCVEYTNTNGNIYISAVNTSLYVELTIKDTGVGISEQDLPHIFDRFYKGKNSKVTSVGIGLAFAKAIITKQNGSIEAESELGIGTTFVVKFYK